MAKEELNLLDGEDAGLKTLDISQAEKHGTLQHSASVLSSDNDVITPGLDAPGPRVINFADILKYNYVPLAATLKVVLEVVTEAFGTPVEIEYAVDLTKDEAGNASFYLLQVKPIVGTGAGYSIDPATIYCDSLLIFSNKSMGNGIIDDIADVIYVEPGKFDNMLTNEMADEIAGLNEKMLIEGRRYVLIGPGRWGTKDRFLGIPVVWPQISNARVIVEVGLPDFHLDASLGSHFFHNVTSMNVGYFSVNHGSHDGTIEWDKLKVQNVVESGRFFRHIRFEKPLLIRMDGKKGMAVISMNI
jgi:hypothetical protein